MKSLLILLLVASLLAGCSEDSNSQMSGMESGKMNETALEHAAKHLDPKYVCPMHPQIVRDELGNCPICGMNLVKKETEEESSSGPRKILYYRHPHNPSITSDKLMQDEMGMDYVPIYDDGGGVSVKISPAVENNLGVRTATTQKDKLWRRIDTVGYVDFDENRISHIHLRTKGWIEKLKVKSEGERVTKGQLLFEVYSPELVNAQEEFLQALRSGRHGLVNASRERLIALGIAASQIERLSKTRKVEQYVRVYAGQDGIVSKLSIREGMYVTPQMEVMSLADLSSVWLLAEVFEKQADWVATEQPADVRLDYLPGKVWEGKVEYIYPSLDPKTRTLKVRLRFDNPEEQLKPNMFAKVTIYGGAKKDILVVPREALIRTGREDRVILSAGEGRFLARTVVAGIESGDWVEIQRGLTEGDKVVTSGQFLIDSEASLKASLQRMSGAQSQDMSEMQNETNNAAEIMGTGVIMSVDAGNNRVNMSHDPIPALQWPSMTMDFSAQADIPLDTFKAGDKVEFELKKGMDGYVINKLNKAN